MKKTVSYIALFAAGVMAFTACEKKAEHTAEFTTTGDKAFVRVIHAAPSFRQVFNAPDSFNVYINNAKVNGALLTYAGLFPPGGTQFGYIAVDPGLQNIKLTVAGTVTPDSIPLTLLSKIINRGEYYSIIITDSIKSANDSARMIVPDVYSRPNPGSYTMRFVHAVLNDTVGKNIDVYSTRRNANIFNAVKPGQIIRFQTFPYNAELSDTLYVRRAGTMLNLDTLAGASFGNQRAYTLLYRGNGDLNSTAKARTIATYLHQ